jgi:polyisoprenoid-binding protein YceI
VTTAIATTTTYRIDKAPSEVTFQVRHLLTKVRGRFSDFNGTIEYDEENPEPADFFDVGKIPALTFRSTGIRRTGDDTFARGATSASRSKPRRRSIGRTSA